MKRKFKFYLKIVYRACVFSKTVILLTFVLVFYVLVFHICFFVCRVILRSSTSVNLN